MNTADGAELQVSADSRHFQPRTGRKDAKIFYLEWVLYFAENESTVELLKVSPGRRMVEGKLV